VIWRSLTECACSYRTELWQLILLLIVVHTVFLEYYFFFCCLLPVFLFYGINRKHAERCNQTGHRPTPMEKPRSLGSARSISGGRGRVFCRAPGKDRSSRPRYTRSFKVIEVGTNRMSVCDFLLVINSNWHHVSYFSELSQLIVQISDTLRF